MSADGNSPAAAAADPVATPRSRLPRWTRRETMVLIQAKRTTEQRGLQPAQPVRLRWAVVSAYCRRHGVERGPMQCRKRWGNLSWDLKKIVAWEKNAAVPGAGEAPPLPLPQQQHKSFWDMRGDERRTRRLPSSFDREVYDALVGAAATKLLPESGDEMDPAEGKDADDRPPPIMVVPISARMYLPPASSQQECSDDPVTESAKKPGAASDKNSMSQQDSEATFGAGVGAECTGAGAAATTSIERQVTEALERGNRLLVEQLEAQRATWDMNREHTRALLAAVNRLTDAVRMIVDKL